MSQLFVALCELVRTIRDGSESTRRAVRMGSLLVVVALCTGGIVAELVWAARSVR